MGMNSICMSTAMQGGEIPCRAVIKDAHEILPASEIFRDDHASVAGPLPFTDALKHYDILEHGKAREVFYPIRSPDWHDIFDPASNAEQQLTTNTHAVQWWNSRAVANGINKNATFPQDSLIEKLKRKHGIE